MSKEFSFDDLTKRYQKRCKRAHAKCVLVRALVGGVPAAEDDLRAYIKHYLKPKPEAGQTQAQAEESAFQRIMAEELGERAVEIGTGEIQQKLVNQLNVVRKDKHGPWLGDWMIKACLKASASRIGLYKDKRGTKGDMAEMGQVRALGISLLNKPLPHQIYFVGPEGKGATIRYEQFRGQIISPQGPKSIITDAEVVPEGSQFEFEFRFADGKISNDDVGDIFAVAMTIGLGSAKSFERGKFKIDKLIVD